MSDVESRILVAVEAGEALKRIGDVKGGIGEITAAREKDLQTIRQKTAALKGQAAAERTANQAAAKAQDKGYFKTSRYGTASYRSDPNEEKEAISRLRERADVEKFVTNRIKERKEASEQELKIAQAASRLEIASEKEKLASLDAYNAALKYGNALQEKKLAIERKTSARNIWKASQAERKAQDEFIRLRERELSAVSETRRAQAKYNEVLSGNANASGKAAKGMREYSARTIAARSASRLLGIDIGEGVNPAMIKMGIIVAGVASAVKIATYIYDKHMKKLNELADIARRNTDSARSVTERNKELAERQRAAMDSLDSLRSKERLSNVERLKTSELLKQLGTDYHQLGIEIDASSGRVKNFDQVNAKLERLQINREQDDIRRQLKNLEEEKRRQKEIMDSAGISGWWLLGIPQLLTWDRYTRIGGEQDAMAAAEKIDRIGEESAKLRQRFGELGKMNPEARAAEALKDRAQALGVLIEQENKQFAIQQMRLRGDETGAAWLERELELRKQIADLTEQELEDYERVWRARQYATQNTTQNTMQVRQFRERRDSLLESMRQAPAYRYRTTSQDAVYANSIEGVRMQTRIMSQNPERELLKQQLSVLEKMELTLNEIHDDSTIVTIHNV